MKTDSISAPQGKEQVTQSDGIELCRKLYETLKPIGLFPALTGGLLYKDGNRKDIDIVLYRHRQDVESFEISQFEIALKIAGLSDFKHFGFVTKAKWRGFTVDLFNPETNDTKDESHGE